MSRNVLVNYCRLTADPVVMVDPTTSSNDVVSYSYVPGLYTASGGVRSYQDIPGATLNLSAVGSVTYISTEGGAATLARIAAHIASVEGLRANVLDVVLNADYTQLWPVPTTHSIAAFAAIKNTFVASIAATAAIGQTTTVGIAANASLS